MNREVVIKALIKAYEEEYLNLAKRSLTLLFDDELKNTTKIEDTWIYRLTEIDDHEDDKWLRKLTMLGEAIIAYAELIKERDKEYNK